MSAEYQKGRSSDTIYLETFYELNSFMLVWLWRNGRIFARSKSSIDKFLLLEIARIVKVEVALLLAGALA